ncbi:ACT domain-containing protein [Riemerella anatipestifer]|uniref:ACT domain-containing protein n=1 Tax=Riemerella anatipestifer TaxID=34085 RepID=UPI00129E2E9B|nr:ACT domain-containing protein [Riemerella anatipestifer]MBT0551788.1 ACT domain-containing protein [Riemerella anatipestifer]MBT0553973.1 ACT domain-containing protein [Riemerella anatipestifer]MCE3024585.1 ACT domain-containing protein [Riemerella anatipestifer]MCU7541519.1 ACT domain-containing protein [Riemerella anatipestifer]MCU7560153.1 ACT domain-containing protein [Riemerella anatipestifer]
MPNQENLNIYPNKAIINFEGKDFLGQIGIDSRIFNALNRANISVGVISQQAIENGISVLVDESNAEDAVQCLKEEFKNEINQGIVSQIYSVDGITVIGLVTPDFNKILTELQRNKIFPLLLNQVASAGRVNIVVATNQAEKTKNIIETELYGKPKAVHLVLFGHGNVGGTLIEQILDSAYDILQRKRIDLKIVAIANSKNIVFNKGGFGSDWRQKVRFANTQNTLEDLFQFVKEHQFENLIAVDNTASKDFVKNYLELAEQGFDLVSSNKIYNTLPIGEYKKLRRTLEKNKKKYLYETNVGAGLPLIDTIKLLHLSGEDITRIKGVFSGSLSYIFNNFSVRGDAFSTIIKEAMENGFTEPDPREDLSGNDVARKLLILARELDLVNEFEDINIQNLIPENLSDISKEDFISGLNELDDTYQKIKDNQETGYVLRYVGDLHGNLREDKGVLDVKLVSVPAHSALGQLKGSDSIFEVYTESYGENPIVIMGAGAGAKVTARGVFGDILRLSETK